MVVNVVFPELLRVPRVALPRHQLEPAPVAVVPQLPENLEVFNALETWLYEDSAPILDDDDGDAPNPGEFAAVQPPAPDAGPGM